MNSLVSRLLLVLLLTFCGSVAFAHDGSMVSPGMTLQDTCYWDHDEMVGNPDQIFKGTATFTVTNTGTDQWGDFHFQVYDGYGGNATSVIFADLATGGQDPTSTQSLDSWTIGTNGSGYATIDLFFYNDPVNPSETASFTVYTDNTAQSLNWFGMMIYPTPVPEPATIAILGIGALAIFSRKRRK